jgi:uncharacterized heparinase superfamily protein
MASATNALATVVRQLNDLVAGPVDATNAAGAVSRSLHGLVGQLQKQPNQKKVFLNFCTQLLCPLLACRSKFAQVSNEAVRGLERVIDKLLGAILFHEMHIQGNIALFPHTAHAV